MRHLETNSLLSKQEHGFRPKSSCLTQPLECIKELESAISEMQCVNIIHLDCKKAFSMVPHQRLLAKTEAVSFFL